MALGLTACGQSHSPADLRALDHRQPKEAKVSSKQVNVSEAPWSAEQLAALTPGVVGGMRNLSDFTAVPGTPYVYFIGRNLQPITVTTTPVRQPPPPAESELFMFDLRTGAARPGAIFSPGTGLYFYRRPGADMVAVREEVPFPATQSYEEFLAYMRLGSTNLHPLAPIQMPGSAAGALLGPTAKGGESMVAPLLWTASGSRLWELNYQTGTVVQSLPLPSGTATLDLSADGHTLYLYQEQGGTAGSGEASGELLAIDTDNGEEVGSVGLPLAGTVEIVAPAGSPAIWVEDSSPGNAGVLLAYSAGNLGPPPAGFAQESGAGTASAATVGPANWIKLVGNALLVDEPGELVCRNAVSGQILASLSCQTAVPPFLPVGSYDGRLYGLLPAGPDRATSAIASINAPPACTGEAAVI